MAELLSACQAAKVIGCAPQMVRERMKRGIWKFGEVVTTKQSGMQSNTYEINKRRFAAWLEMSVEELDKKLVEDEHDEKTYDS